MLVPLAILFQNSTNLLKVSTHFRNSSTSTCKIRWFSFQGSYRVHPVPAIILTFLQGYQHLATFCKVPLCFHSYKHTNGVSQPAKHLIESVFNSVNSFLPARSKLLICHLFYHGGNFNKAAWIIDAATSYTEAASAIEAWDAHLWPECGKCLAPVQRCHDWQLLMKDWCPEVNRTAAPMSMTCHNRALILPS